MKSFGILVRKCYVLKLLVGYNISSVMIMEYPYVCREWANVLVGFISLRYLITNLIKCLIKKLSILRGF